jgi:hypothetical protein
MDCTDKVIEIKNVRVAFEDFAPTSVTDSIVVSRDSVRILKKTIAALNKLGHGTWKSVEWSRGQSLAPKRARRSLWLTRRYSRP